MAYQMVCGIMRDIEAETKAYNARWAEIHKAGAGFRAHNIARVCARYELESDEFYTAEQKAIAMLAKGE